MRCLVTGGAGFIGRWVVNKLLVTGHDVVIIDDLSNGRIENLRDLEGSKGFLGLIHGDVKDAACLRRAFEGGLDAVFHLAASIHVQKSIDAPGPTLRNDVDGTLSVLEECRRHYFTQNGLAVDSTFDYERDGPRLTRRTPRVAVMSTCMVYAVADDRISELHPYRPASPYAAAKIGADMLALSYFHSYRMPVTVVRPFNTYGPFQKSNGEGGVVSIFLKRDLAGEPLLVKGSGEQTRDLLFVDDCADFVVTAALNPAAEGEIVNAGTGQDIRMSALAEMCVTQGNQAKRIAHDHPQAEIMRLCCDATKAKRLLGWSAKTTLGEGLATTRTWLSENRWAW